MSQEQQLRQMQEQMISNAKSAMQMVNNLTTTEIWSENGLSSDQKKEVHSVFTDLISGKSTPESIAKATDLMKKFTGK
jgi:hypothetical protein